MMSHKTFIMFHNAFDPMSRVKVMAPIRTTATEGGVMLDGTRDVRASALSSLSENMMETI